MAFFAIKMMTLIASILTTPPSKAQCKKHFQIRALSRKEISKGVQPLKGKLKENCILSMLIEMMLNTKEVKNCQKIPLD